MTIALNDKQIHARDEAIRFARNPDNAIFMVSGLAGTGKTTVLNQVVERLMELGHRPAVCTPTGKAAHVINQKGSGKFRATTLHKVLTVRPIDNLAHLHKRLDELTLQDMGPGLSDEEKAEEQALLNTLDEQKTNKLSFEPIPTEVLQKSFDLLIFDEASMIGKVKTYDLLIAHHTVPKLCFGDAAQLPPVQDVPAIRLDKANVRLTEIMRQSADSGILPVAHHVYNRGDWLPKKQMESFADVKIRKDFHEDMIVGFETTHQILCWTNKMRHNVARRVRRELFNYTAETHPFLPLRGESLMVDKNDDERRLLKGQMLLIDEVTHYNPRANPFLAVVRCTDEAGKVRTLTLSITDLADGYNLNDENLYGTRYRQDSFKRWADKEGVQVMWPYCLTVHKAQGSEWPRVLYLADMPQSHQDWRKHAYTAVTRASQELVVCCRSFYYG